MELTAAQLASFTASALDIGGDVDTGYSGKGMFGRRCIAVHCPLPVVQHVFAFGTSLGARDDELAADLGEQQIAIDQLGLGAIFYWPDVTFPAPVGA